MDLRLSDEQQAAQETARELAEKKLMPRAAKLDAGEAFPEEAVAELAELGLLGMMTPAEFGGAQLDAVGYALSLMEIARADASVAVTLSVNNLVAETIGQMGSAEQKAQYLPKLNTPAGLGAFALTEPHAGSDAKAIRTRAEKKGDHYVLDGEKTWITNATHAGTFLVMAVTDPAARTRGISAFIVDGKSKGMTIGKPEPKMGQRASHSCPVFFSGCKVPAQNLLGAEGAGLKVALSALDSGRIGIASLGVGITQACLDEMVGYSKERQAFGKPIGEFQAIQWMIADTAVELEAARALTLSTAWRKTAGEPASEPAAMAKLFSSEAANRAAYRAVQVFGGYGYSREYRVERLYRDARVLTLYEGTSEIQRLVIARNQLK
ncbi:MAG: acyl-CoA dehydrogenase family protein [Planctomycetota bacterium]|nr:acyl-CoA dehydrogenase family protein [Planctomycetota bacterium]